MNQHSSVEFLKYVLLSVFVGTVSACASITREEVKSPEPTQTAKATKVKFVRPQQMKSDRHLEQSYLALDGNKDKAVTLNEIQQFAKRDFRLLDAEKRGKIKIGQLEAKELSGTKHAPMARDNEYTEREYVELVQATFKKMDDNSNGSLTYEEYLNDVKGQPMK